jgi:hypothetical protein
MSDRKALLVGINKFKNLPAATLRGCVNDANDMSLLLKDLLGFSDSDITILTDAQATKARIMASLKEMVADAVAGNLRYLVFSLSSHGTQIPDRSGDEADRADEAFCPYDLAQKGNQWDPARIISDDELHDLFVQLPKQVLLECYFDTCHSGTGLKLIDPAMLLIPDAPRPRYLPPPSYEAFLEVRDLPIDTLGSKIKKDRELSSHNILWAGCKADQTSADAFFAGRPNGAFTYAFIKAVRESNNTLTRGQIRDKVRVQLKKAGFDQIPQLECDATNRKAKAQ